MLVAEVIEHLEPSRGGVFVDCTVGFGGHARALLAAGATKVLGIDRDPAAVTAAATALAEFGDRVEVVHRDYRELNAILDERGVAAVDGVLADLGVSSVQLDSARGFSFKRDEALDMRMDTSTGETAAEALARVDEKTLADVIFAFGEERHSRRVARSIVAARAIAPIETTGQLAQVVRRAVPHKGYSRIDPATRTFQAIRIWVNGELDALDQFLGHAVDRLRPDGRLAVIAFHSLEDRIVKHTFRELQTSARTALAVVTKRPIAAGDAEVERNPRARSAKLRVIRRLAAAEQDSNDRVRAS